MTSIRDYDGILIEEVLIPLQVGSLVINTVTQHVTFTLVLAQGNEQAVTAIKKGPVVKVYHPELRKAGISLLTITELGSPEYYSSEAMCVRGAGPEAEARWHVRVEGKGNGGPKYVRYLTQAGPVEEDQEERRAKYIAWMQNHGVHLRLGPLLLRAVSWPFIVMKLNTLYRENSHTDCVEAFAKTFDMAVEDAREAAAVFMGQFDGSVR